jgi:hypothetical protein
MADLQPTSQESEHIGPALTLSVTIWVLIIGGGLSVIAGLLLSARSHTLEHAPSATAPARPDAEVSHVHSDLFSLPGAGESLKARQLQGLENYGWVDRSRGIVRIPIDVAIELESQEPRR